MSDSILKRAVRMWPAALLMLGVATGIQAHHSFAAQYDNSKPVTMTGALTKLEWTNPHVYIYIDVTDEATKKVTNWAFEMGPPHMLQRSGWKKNALKTGEPATAQRAMEQHIAEGKSRLLRGLTG